MTAALLRLAMAGGAAAAGAGRRVAFMSLTSVEALHWGGAQGLGRRWGLIGAGVERGCGAAREAGRWCSCWGAEAACRLAQERHMGAEVPSRSPPLPQMTQTRARREERRRCGAGRGGGGGAAGRLRPQAMRGAGVGGARMASTGNTPNGVMAAGG